MPEARAIATRSAFSRLTATATMGAVTSRQVQLDHRHAHACCATMLNIVVPGAAAAQVMGRGACHRSCRRDRRRRSADPECAVSRSIAPRRSDRDRRIRAYACLGVLAEDIQRSGRSRRLAHRCGQQRCRAHRRRCTPAYRQAVTWSAPSGTAGRRRPQQPGVIDRLKPSRSICRANDHRCVPTSPFLDQRCNDTVGGAGEIVEQRQIGDFIAQPVDRHQQGRNSMPSTGTSTPAPAPPGKR